MITSKVWSAVDLVAGAITVEMLVIHLSDFYFGSLVKIFTISMCNYCDVLCCVLQCGVQEDQSVSMW